MYDGHLFNFTNHKIELYDIGFSSLLASDCDALSQLAGIIGRNAEVVRLRQVANSIRSLISKHLWDSTKKTFSNKFPNNTFYSRISPTSFYALLAKAATDDQAIQQVETWLTNASRFCIRPEWPRGVTDQCYWGLPSISADDPAFPPLGYWRGYVWGPTAQLTFWGLQNYDHLPQIRVARKALCVQMAAMMMNQWNINRHICENFSPHKVSSDCTGSKFYHWGALAGLLSIEEEGLWL